VSEAPLRNGDDTAAVDGIESVTDTEAVDGREDTRVEAAVSAAPLTMVSPMNAEE
jgi:hypothetical protein